MIHYFKEVTGIKYFPSTEINLLALYGLEVYAISGQKYKIWSWFLPFHKTRIATQRLWKHYYNTFPEKNDLYTDKDIQESYDVMLKPDGSTILKTKVVITFSDNEGKVLFFDNNEDAEKFIKEIVDKYNLTLDKY